MQLLFARRLLNPDSLSRATVLYCVLASLACFWRLGAVGLIHMEGMIVDGARRMLATGDWVVPHVYGEIYTFKPALGYWLAAAALRLADPPPEWLVRLPFAASGFLMGLVVLLLVGRITNPRTGFVAAVASVSAGLFVQHVRLAEFDVPLTAGVGIAVAASCVDLAGERSSYRLWLLAYAGLAFAFLAKGVPALMVFGPGLLAAAWATGRFRRLFGWRHLLAATLFLAAIGGYLAAAYRSAGPVAFEQPLLESKVRGLSWGTRQHSAVLSAAEDPTGAAAEQTTARPIDAILKSLTKPFDIWAAFLPWSLLVFFAMGRRATDAGADRSALLLRGAGSFLVAGALVFMFVPTHETRYFLPLAVPFGLLAGIVLTREDRRPEKLLAVCAIGAVLSGLAMLIFGGGADTPPVPATHRAALVAGGGSLAALAIGSLRRKRVDRALSLLILAAFGWLAVESLAAQLRRAGHGRDLRAEAKVLDPALPAAATLWVLGPSDLAGKHASLYYYLGRPIETFRPPDIVPPPGSHCLLSTDRLPAEESLAFEEVARVTTSRYTYLVGRCGAEPGSRPASSRTD